VRLLARAARAWAPFSSRSARAFERDVALIYLSSVNNIRPEAAPDPTRKANASAALQASPKQVIFRGSPNMAQTGHARTKRQTTKREHEARPKRTKSTKDTKNPNFVRDLRLPSALLGAIGAIGASGAVRAPRATKPLSRGPSRQPAHDCRNPHRRPRTSLEGVGPWLLGQIVRPEMRCFRAGLVRTVTERFVLVPSDSAPSHLAQTPQNPHGFPKTSSARTFYCDSRSRCHH
jgi:hypothetical protein